MQSHALRVIHWESPITFDMLMVFCTKMKTTSEFEKLSFKCQRTNVAHMMSVVCAPSSFIRAVSRTLIWTNIKSTWILNWISKFNTRMHSSRMRTARLLTVSRSAGGGSAQPERPGHVTCDACWECHPTPCGQKEWHTLVKILPCRKLRAVTNWVTLHY